MIIQVTTILFVSQFEIAFGNNVGMIKMDLLIKIINIIIKASDMSLSSFVEEVKAKDLAIALFF